MSRIYSLYTCHEIVIDNDGNIIAEYKTDLPDSTLIIKQFCDAFNSAAKEYLLNIINKEFNDKILSLKAQEYPNNNHETTINVVITGKPGTRFTEKLRNEIFEWINSQYSDGWGEGFFGLINVMTTDTGTHFYIE